VCVPHIDCVFMFWRTLITHTARTSVCQAPAVLSKSFWSCLTPTLFSCCDAHTPLTLNPPPPVSVVFSHLLMRRWVCLALHPLYFHSHHSHHSPLTLNPPPPVSVVFSRLLIRRWVCYAEKTHGDFVLPHISTVKSPQQVMGTLVKGTVDTGGEPAAIDQGGASGKADSVSVGAAKGGGVGGAAVDTASSSAGTVESASNAASATVGSSASDVYVHSVLHLQCSSHSHQPHQPHTPPKVYGHSHPKVYACTRRSHASTFLAPLLPCACRPFIQSHAQHEQHLDTRNICNEKS
jgi:hypothetical protein